MRIVHVESLQSVGAFARSTTWRRLRKLIHGAIRRVEWPKGSGSFTIFPQRGKKRGEGNGIVPIKIGFMEELVAHGWQLEERISGLAPEGGRSQPGKVDAVLYTKGGPVALEWETGNISSSHRSINKMCMGLLKEVLACGMVVVPSRDMCQYLTDRIANYAELAPYLDLWRSVPCKAGVFEIVVIEHDAESLDVPRIPKLTDGRARG